MLVASVVLVALMMGAPDSSEPNRQERDKVDSRPASGGEEALPDAAWFVAYGDSVSEDVLISCPKGAREGACYFTRTEVTRAKDGTCRVRTGEARAPFEFVKSSSWTWTRTLISTACPNFIEAWTLRRSAGGKWQLTYRFTQLRPPANDDEAACKSAGQDFSSALAQTPSDGMECRRVRLGPPQ
jgi:hypothetical protein